MKSGQIIQTFTLKDGRKAVVRTPRWEDLDDLMDFINSLVREEAPILREKEVSRIEEAEWLAERLVSLEKDEIIHFVAEVDGKVVASAEIAKRRGHQKHVGVLGIAVKSGYRRLGIATKLIEALLEEAKKQGLKVIILDVYEKNLPALNLYKRMGFKEVGRAPKAVYWKGECIDDIKMARILE